MLFQGVKLLLSNWRLTLIELLPAVWIWLATYDLKLHFLRGHTFRDIRGPILIPIFVVIVALTAASFYLNAVFGFAVSSPGVPEVRPAFAQARQHAAVILGPGAVVGLGLAVASIIFPRWGRWWFAISLSIVLAVMTYAYVAIPARLMGVRPKSLPARQVVRRHHRRNDHRHRLRPPAPTQPVGDPDARLQVAVHPGHHPADRGSDTSGRRDRCHEGSEDEHQTVRRS